MKLTIQKLHKLIEEALTERKDCDSAERGADLRDYRAERRPDGALIIDDELLGRARTHGQKGLALPDELSEQEVYDAWTEGIVEYIIWFDQCNPHNPLPSDFKGYDV